MDLPLLPLFFLLLESLNLPLGVIPLPSLFLERQSLVRVRSLVDVVESLLLSTALVLVIVSLDGLVGRLELTGAGIECARLRIHVVVLADILFVQRWTGTCCRSLVGLCFVGVVGVWIPRTVDLR